MERELFFADKLTAGKKKLTAVKISKWEMLFHYKFWMVCITFSFFLRETGTLEPSDKTI